MDTNGQTRAECGSCSKCWPIEGLTEAKNLSMRTEPGQEIPAGECPDCGALCYIIKQPGEREAAAVALAALLAAAEIIKTARRYFPKAIKHRDKWALELTNAEIGKAITKIEAAGAL